MRNIMNLVNLSFNNFLSIKKMALFIMVVFGVASLVNPGFSSMCPDARRPLQPPYCQAYREGSG